MGVCWKQFLFVVPSQDHKINVLARKVVLGTLLQCSAGSYIKISWTVGRATAKSSPLYIRSGMFDVNINSSINRIYTKLGKLYQTRFKLPDISSHYHITVWTKHVDYI